MNLEPWKSGYNGKIILRNQAQEERFEWEMDSSDTDVMIASGAIFLPVDEAWVLLKSLSDVLERGGFPHEIWLEDEKGILGHSVAHLWKE